jgi:putative Ca2+/H+ antiporter (TMEM165/GDT1 family)
MENLLGWIIILVIATLVGVRGGNILSEKGRPYWIGFALGFFFSLLGLAVCYLIPATTEVKEQRMRMQR